MKKSKRRDRLPLNATKVNQNTTSKEAIFEHKTSKNETFELKTSKNKTTEIVKNKTLETTTTSSNEVRERDSNLEEGVGRSFVIYSLWVGNK